MIQEYALDPEMLANEFPGDVRFFREAFGPNSIRFLSCFPKRWREELRGAFKRSHPQGDTMAEKAVLAFADRLLEKAIKRNHGQLAPGPWLTKAEREHSLNAFHAILTKENPNGNTAVITLDGVHDHPKWDDPRRCRPLRTASAMAPVVEPLLRRAQEIVFVDPFFDILSDEFRPSFIEYFKCIGKSLVTVKPKVTIITGLKKVWERGTREPSKENIDSFVNDCVQSLPRMMPPNCTATIAIIKEFPKGEDNHDRFILTRNVAIAIGKGLGCSAESTGSGVNMEVYTYGNGESLWELYNLQRQPAAFEKIIEPFTVQS